jgi:putative transposase
MSALMIAINTLVEREDAEGRTVVYRLLHVDPAERALALIDVQDSRAFPVWWPVVQMQADLQGGVVRARTEDPFHADTSPDAMLSESARRVRDDRWAVVGPLVDPAAGDPGDVLRVSTRSLLVHAASAETGRSRDKIYDWLRQYWRGGQTINALLPQFSRCGGSGEERVAGTKKRGRPRKVLIAGTGDQGLNVTQDVLERILKGARQFLFRKVNGRQLGPKEAHQLTLETFFRQGVVFKDGALVPLLLRPDECPTLTQFKYWAEKHRTVVDEMKARFGERRFNLQHRPVLGSTEHLSRGPGDLFLIDATVGDIYLLSELDRRRVVGRPVVYLVIDHWTRMIVGLYVGLEGPSWLGAMMALENAFTNKVEFCRQFGVEIAPDDWPCHHVPRALTGDRGEMLSGASDNLVPAFRLRLVNTPAFRADFKSFVESQFRLTNETGIRRQPGWVDKARDRGDPDYRLDATLTLHEFTALMIHLSLLNNRSRGLRNQVPLNFPLPRHLDPTPLDLWDWGTEQGLNLGRVMDRQNIRVNLLPTYEARATREGLSICGGALMYDSETARKEGWFIGVPGRQKTRVALALDPRDVSVAYLRTDRGRRIEICPLTPKFDLRYHGRMLDEVLDDRERQEIIHRESEPRRAQALAEFHAHEAALQAAAAERRTEALGSDQVIPILRGQREARREERTARRREEAFSVPASEQAVPTVAAIPPEDDGYLPFPS